MALGCPGGNRSQHELDGRLELDFVCVDDQVVKPWVLPVDVVVDS